ncbi:RteC domain-containing protein [Mucilaginibacter sp. ZT4R22]|uniref:RteC domain-containing protein n=1 Tax=Mucilaginibacter pankratovii TaxID=2772110 RepID=A0ABR7WYQ4_9SPHI|nr:RteC domain-containing protein [Mucilaginibacter pankratovii]MBD1366574.1 RteC domain-containing protein [Mucilaginibacter pankratovii]
MLFEVCEQEFRVMEAALGKINSSTELPAERLKEALTVIRKSLHFLSDHVLAHPLGSEEEQIKYGKVLLPKFYALYIYHQEWYAILSALPVTTNKKIRAFWLDELRVVSRFPSRYSLHHAYYKTAGTYLDKLLFVPGADTNSTLVPEIPEYDLILPTSCSYLFAKFRAYEMLSASIMEAMGNTPPMVHAPAAARKRTREMRWTGESINLVEVGFGLYDTKQLNDGNASLVEIFEWMEEVLHVRIGRPARRFEELETRKTTSPTSYLDKMRHEINMRIDRKLNYDPDAFQLKRRANRVPPAK